jgi:hypothetical protein
MLHGSGLAEIIQVTQFGSDALNVVFRGGGEAKVRR